MLCLRPVVIFFLAFNVYCVKAKVITDIVGGYNTQIENYPYQVAIIVDRNLWCGGSILSEKYVLTAAHCIFETVGKKLIIHAGSTYWARPGSVHHVDMSVTYGSSQNLDVAVVRVTEPFVFDAKHQPIKLSPPGKVAQPGAMATVTGWGTTGANDDAEVSDFLMSVDVPIVDRVSCNISYNGDILDGEMCAGSPNKDSCQGDSGGPLVIDGFQVGVVSMGTGCGLPSFPGIYADVSYFHDWILQQASLGQ